MTSAVSLEIEPLKPSNLDELVAMFDQVDDAHFFHANRESAEQFLGQTEDVHVLGRLEGVLVAFGMLRGWSEGFEVPSLGIAVRRDREGQGIGRAMMKVLEGIARERSARSIRLRVHEKNERARSLYRAAGYRDVGFERGEKVMVLDLDA